MNEKDWLAEQFEGHRPQLRRIAYRMLGSIDESDDAVQEAWIRLSRSDDAAIENLGGWLTTVVGRVCLDILRRRRASAEVPFGSWLPEPIVTIDDSPNPEEEVLAADAVGLALLVVLETLSPAERLAFVLHDMFGVPFEEISPIVERSIPATRQLASRARRRVRSGGASAPSAPDADARQQRRVLDAFLAASREGDFEALVAVLDPEVSFRADRGRLAAPAAAGLPAQVRGAHDVATALLERAPRFAHLARHATVNGSPGFVVVRGDQVISVVAMAVAGGRITEINLIVDREKLARVRV
jgi:RNA polymerase sigma-70 factor (ECF subfamily)